MLANRFSKEALMYEGSVKRVYSSPASANLIFEFTDDYSVFDWGKMPDTIPYKGRSLALIMATLFSRLEKQGIKTHYLDFDGQNAILVQKINVHRPERKIENGRSLYIYPKNLEKPFLIPLEVVFRFEVCAGSSFIQRHAEKNYQVGHQFSEPFIEMFTKLEDKDRPLSEGEAFEISGLPSTQYEDLISKTRKVAEILKAEFGQRGIRLLDGKLEWGLTAEGEVFLVDAIGPDELRLEKNGVALSKEVLRAYYRQTPWYAELEKAKDQVDWKSTVSAPPSLPPELRKTVGEMYQTLAFELAEKKDSTVPSLEEVLQKLSKTWTGVKS